jgi:hypothetical protein
MELYLLRRSPTTGRPGGPRSLLYLWYPCSLLSYLTTCGIPRGKERQPITAKQDSEVFQAELSRQTRDSVLSADLKDTFYIQAKPCAERRPRPKPKRSEHCGRLPESDWRTEKSIHSGINVVHLQCASSVSQDCRSHVLMTISSINQYK